MLRKNSVQPRLGGIRLPSAVKQADEIITNLRNLVAMQEHKGNPVDILNPGVLQFEIFGTLDGSVHLAFDLAHDLRSVSGLGLPNPTASGRRSAGSGRQSGRFQDWHKGGQLL